MADLNNTIVTAFNTEIDVVSNNLAASFTLAVEEADKYIVMIDNTSGGAAATVTFAAGVGANSDQGDLAVEVADAAKSIVQLEGSRFKAADGDIDVTGAIATGGTLANCKVYVLAVK